MTIKQFNGEWVAREDRIIFRMNTQNGEGYAFWLTRMIVRGLLDGAQHLGVHQHLNEHPPEVAQAMQAFEAQSVAQGLNYQETYEGAHQMPLGEQPILITSLKMTRQEDQTSVNLEMLDGRHITMVMPQQMFLVMIALLQKLQSMAQWGLEGQATTTVLDATQPQTAPHLH